MGKSDFDPKAIGKASSDDDINYQHSAVAASVVFIIALVTLVAFCGLLRYAFF